MGRNYFTLIYAVHDLNNNMNANLLGQLLCSSSIVVKESMVRVGCFLNSYMTLLKISMIVFMFHVLVKL